MWSKYIFPALVTIALAYIGLAIILRIPGGSFALPTAASPAAGKKLLVAA